MKAIRYELPKETKLRMYKHTLSFILLSLTLSACGPQPNGTSAPVLKSSSQNSGLKVSSPTETAASAPTDLDRVNYILADLSKGVDFEYYKNLKTPEAKEAIKQWESGIRVTNNDSFERISIPGKGFQIVYKGTQISIDPKAIQTEKVENTLDEGQTRIMLVDMSKGADIVNYYKSLTTPEAKEAIKRWENNIRPTNSEIFDRIAIPKQGFQIVYKGTTTKIQGLDVTLATVANQLNEARIRTIMVDMSKDPGIVEYYKTVSETEASEALNRWGKNIRPTNAEHFERVKAVDGSFAIVYKGTEIAIDGLAVKLGTGTSTTSTIDNTEISPVNDIPGLNEARVRTILVDLSKGVETDYYETQTDTESFEALKRWDEGIRPTNTDIFERKSIDGRGVLIVYKGTEIAIDGMSVILSLPNTFDEGRIKYILAELSLGVDFDYFANLDNAEAKEATKRWQAGTRIRNISSFERITILGQGPKVVYKGTQTVISGQSIELKSSNSLDDSRVRYILAELSQGVPESYYNTVEEAEAKEAQRIWGQGTRVKNASSFERKNVVDEGIIITYRGTNIEIDGQAVILDGE